MEFDKRQDNQTPSSEVLRSAWQSFQSGHFSHAGELCQRILAAEPHNHDALHLHEQTVSGLAGKISLAATNFKRTPITATVDALRDARREFIMLLELQPNISPSSPWTTIFKEAHQTLMNCGLRDFPLLPAEHMVLNKLRADLERAPGDTPRPVVLLSAMLLCRSYELPPPEYLRAIPEWLCDIYVDFLLEMPAVFNREGEADQYVDYMILLTGIFHKIAITDRGIAQDNLARKLSYLFTIKSKFIQSYFNTRNLRDLFSKRADIISATLIASGHKTLMSFPPRAQPLAKIRLGIYIQNLAPLTETYFTLTHYEQIDRSRFDITLYIEKTTGLPLEQHCMAHADRFVVLPQNDIVSKVNRIRNDDLDILLISSNLTAVTNVATLVGTSRLARIQVATVSSPVTTGFHHMDVMLSSEWNEPEVDAPDQYTEHLYLMAESINYYAFQYDKDPSDLTIKRANFGINSDQIVFFSGANYYKILPELSRAWARILAAVPNSILMLMPFNYNWNSEYQIAPFLTRIRQQLSEAGVDIKRLIVVDPVPARADLHKVLALSDIYLDAYPFAGACSMLDPIIAGIPAVTRRGPVGRSNHAASLSRMIGLEELITVSEQDYVAAAISLANNSARRQSISEHLRKLKSMSVPPYYDIKVYSTRVGNALQDLYARYTGRYRALGALDGATLTNRVQELADSIVGVNFELNTLTDIGLIHSLVKPYFRQYHRGRSPYMVDVGACHGEMSAPLLADGWSADLFEPDPDARQVLEKNMANFKSNCRIYASAVSNSSVDKITFHKAHSHGLSGLGDSPFGTTDHVVEVPNVRLSDFYRQRQLDAVDFLKIDAEGYDFDVLASNDFSVMKPRLIMIEYGTHFARQPLAAVNAAITRMKNTGYGAIVFNCTDDGNFQKGQWIYRIIDIFVDRAIPADRAIAFGNILFYRAEDKEFLLTLYALLENCRPRADVWRVR